MENPRRPGVISPIPDHDPTPWIEALAGIALFLALGASAILEKTPYDWEAPGGIGRMQLWNVLFWIRLLLPPFAVAIGWARYFPRWTYPYVLLAVVAGISMTTASSPAASLFGTPTFGEEMWRWRALVPLLLACGAGLLVTRSFRPVSVLVYATMKDLTRITYALFIYLPALVLVGFDEIDWRYSLPWTVALMLLIAGSALAYLRSRSPQQRVVSLTAGVLLTLTITAIVSTLYWLESGGVYVPGMIAAVVIISAVLLAPSFFGLARQRQAGEC